MSRRAERLRILDQLGPPDLWPDIRDRVPRPPQERRVAGRVLVVALALAISAVAVAFAMRAFEVDEGSTRPASTVTNGRIALAVGPDGDVFVVEPDGTGLQRLADRHDGGQEGGLEMAWSPDGAKLAFTDYRGPDGARDLFVVDADRGEPVAVSGPLEDADSPAWSPDGTELAFTGFDDVAFYEIYVVEADGSGLRRLTDERDNGVDGAHMPAWSPDGTQIAYSVNRYDGQSEYEFQAIFVMNEDGSDHRRLTEGTGVDESPIWSPDGSSVAFLRKLEDGIAQAYVVDGDGEKPLFSSETMTPISWPVWSPDGRQLLFGTQRPDNSNLGISVVSADGSGAQTLIQDPHVRSPLWSPDGDWIAFVRDDAGSGRASIWAMHPDGSNLHEIADGFEQVSDLAWQPLLIDVSPSEAPEPTGTAPPPAVNPRLTARIPVGSFPRDVAVGAGSVWVSVNDFDDGEPETHSVVRIDPATNEIVATIPVSSAGHLAFGSDAVWAIDSMEGADVLVRIDPDSNRVVATVPVGRLAFDVVVDASGVWVTRDIDSRSGEVIRIDPTTNEIVARIPVEGRIRDVVVGEGGVWVVDSTSTLRVEPSLIHIDPETNEVVATLPGLAALNVATGDGLVWIQGWLSTVDPGVGTGTGDRPLALRLDPATDRIVGDPLPIEWFSPFAFGEGGVWFVGEGPAVSRLNTQTLKVDHSVAVDAVAQDSTVHAALDISSGTIWVANYEDTITRIDLR